MHQVRQKADWPKGEIRSLQHQSDVLKSNPWGDPATRTLNVYLPPGYDEHGAPYVTLWDLAAFTNSGPGHLGWRNHGENIPQRLDRLIHEGRLAPIVMAIPDCYSSLGGNQYLNSSSVGRYADYIVEELVPFLSQHINVIESRSGRGAFGKSSGGYGALSLAMHFPATWGAVAAHAPDVGFDLVYRPDFPPAGRTRRSQGKPAAKAPVEISSSTQPELWSGPDRHLLDLDHVSAQEIAEILRSADGMNEVLSRRVRKTPALRG